MRDTTPPDRTYISRQTELLKQVAERNRIGFLAFGFGSALGAGTQSHAPLRYLCGWDSHEATSLLVVDQKKPTLLVSSPFMLPMARAQLSDLETVALPPALWSEYLRDELAVTEDYATIGFEEMPHSIFRNFGKVWPGIETASADELLASMRQTKDERELALHRQGAEICDTLFDKLSFELKSSQSLWEMHYRPTQAAWLAQLNLESDAKRLGADYCKTWLTIAPCADYPRYWPKETQQTPETGDQVLFGIALTVEGHWAHGIRMGSIGIATAEHKRLWGLVCDMQDAAVDQLTVGSVLSGCETAMFRVLNEFRKSTELKDFIRFRNGHGLGHSYEEPGISDSFPQHFGPSSFQKPIPVDSVVKESMVVELHPNIFIPQIGGAAIGDMFVTTQNGPKNLLTFPRSLMKL
ncbi:M24 family metallopeptidase [uncultured Ruegeria sp.]|uniref:M24 family metallopeptidase n=1 Tax=uncultured Ruegeria sp. TaxID=259304 RepID=UPI0026078AD6|nr:M24 family metallopeptidase [uncultured Ruegeria sp.]